MAKNKKRVRSATEKSRQKRRTSVNKIKAIEKAIKTAGEPHKTELKNRLVYWRQNG